MATAAAVAMIGSTLAISSAASAGGNNPGTPAAAKTDRVSGANRNATAVDAAVDLVGLGNLTNLTIVNGLDFPDGLAAAGLGGDPILLTRADAIPAETQAFLELRAAEGDAPDITIVGGTSVVSDKVAGQLNDLNGIGIVTRIPGVDRYATALAVGTSNGAPNNNAILATGLRAADALSAGPLAILAGDPIILNDGASLRADVRAWLVTEDITSVTIVGGTGAVPQSVQDELANDLGITVTRLAGANRDATSAKIAAFINAFRIAQQPALPVIDSVVLVNRRGFADALAGGPLTERLGGAILTVGVNSLPAETAAFLAANCDAIVNVTAIGGTAVISDEVLAAAAAATKCTVPGISSAALTISNTVQRVMFVGDTAGNTNIVRDATAPTLTSRADSAASGSAANVFEISFAQGLSPSATISAAGVIVYTDNFASLGRAQFVTNWNASAAGALFVAAPGTATAITDFDAVPDEDLQSGGSSVIGEVEGSYKATLVVTFDQAVIDAGAAPIGAVFANANANSTIELLTVANATVTSPAAVVPTAGVTTVTQTWTLQTTAVPTANATVRYAIGDVANVANGQANVAVTMKTITVS